MATWGGYFASIVRKKPDPVLEPKADAQSLTIDQVQSPALSTEENVPTLTKTTEIGKSSPATEVSKKLYDLNTTPGPKDQNALPRSSSNAARVAKMFGYTSPAVSIASATSIAPAKVEPTASITQVEVKPTNSIAPTNEESKILPKPSTNVNQISSTKLTGSAIVANSMVQETTVIQETKKSVGLVPWMFGGKSEKSISGSKEKDSSTTQASVNEKLKTTPNGPSGIPDRLDAEVRVNESIAAPIIQSRKEPFDASNSIQHNGDSSDQDKTLSITTNVKPAQYIATVANLSYPASVMTSSSASTRWNQGSGFSSPASRRDSILSRVSSSSVRPFDISMTSIEEQVARDVRLQAEKENSMKLLALTRSIEQMRAERESMDSERMRMINEEELFKRDEVELKEKDEQMRRFIADVEREQEKERERELEKEREKREMEREREEKERREKREREEREQRELEREKEERERKEREEREQRELERERERREREEREQRELERERERREREEKEQRESEKKQTEEIQSKQLREQERAAEEEREVEDRKREVDKNERSFSPIFDSYDEMKVERNWFEEQDTIRSQKKLIPDDDDFSIYDDYYEEEMDQEENDIILPNKKMKDQDYRSKQELVEEEEYEEELKRQRFLQNGKLRQEEEERQRYAEEQSERYRRNERGPQQRQVPARSPLMNRPQISSPRTPQRQMEPLRIGPSQMGPQMGSPRMGPQMGQQMGSPRMGPPQMGQQMGSPRMGPPQRGPQRSSPQMGPQMGQQMGSPRLGPSQMGQQMGPPRMGPSQMGQQMGSPRMGPLQMGLARVDQFRDEKQQVTKSQESQRKYENIRRQQEVEELNAFEAQEEKEQNIRKAEQKMRQAFAEMTKQKGQLNQYTGLAQVSEPQPPMRTLNQNIIRPPGGLPAGPRGRKAGY
ncbi:hypothetical protein Golomagni_01417 [Golovinomyces magnicellulatus]|nr:hypothetical protein Golomagni_01417 [Golovinomyces magnicellulatus]